MRVATEAAIVGNAAVSFTANWDFPGVDPAPTPDEVRAFVEDYDQARASRLSLAEREHIAACGAFLMAYVARCEHARGTADGAYMRALREHRRDYLAP